MVRDINEDEAVKVGNDVYVGKVVMQSELKGHNVADKGLKPVTEFHGNPPSTDGKIPSQFPISEACGVTYKVNGKELKCKEKLVVVIVKNHKWQADTHGYGGQILYDLQDTKMFQACPIHSKPSEIPSSW